MKVFLGGTCGGSKWREDLIPLLNIDYFNPVVENWTPECQAEELKQREECDYVLYVITPQMEGVYSIAEVVDDSNKRPEKTILCVLESCGYTHGPYSFHEFQRKSLRAVEKMVWDNGATIFNTLKDVANFLNHKGRREISPKIIELKELGALPLEDRPARLKEITKRYATSINNESPPV